MGGRFEKEADRLIYKEGLHPDQVSNMDETSLNYKDLPDKIFAASDEKSAPELKMNKYRLTIAVCSNATGNHKLVIGNYKSHKLLKIPICRHWICAIKAKSQLGWTIIFSKIGLSMNLFQHLQSHLGVG